MKIGVISDTHLSQPSPQLHDIVDGFFRDTALILHAGAFTRLAVLEAFSGKRVVGVHGNMDRKEVKARLPEREVVEIQDYRIGVIHGWGAPNGIEERILACFPDVHVIVYGHTHRPVSHITEGVLMFNPGAFSGSFLLGRNRSVGMLTIDDGISGTHYRF